MGLGRFHLLCACIKNNNHKLYKVGLFPLCNPTPVVKVTWLIGVNIFNNLVFDYIYH